MTERVAPAYPAPQRSRFHLRAFFLCTRVELWERAWQIRVKCGANSVALP